jgi:DNA-directed RNA polymerase subunit M/transcription elongation factor TFIIS
LDQQKLKEKMKHYTRKPSIDVISEPKVAGSKISSKCPYCNNNEATIVYYTVTRGDEDTLIILKCTSCKKTYREGYGY